jgi:hypothetical protein
VNHNKTEELKQKEEGRGKGKREEKRYYLAVF